MKSNHLAALTGHLVLAGAALGIVAPAAALAQDSTTAPAGDAAKVEEILVTANKETRSLQKTASAISVYDAEKLQENGITNLADLSAISPDFTLTSGSDYPVIGLRGISSANVNELGDPAIAVATDGVFLNRASTLGAAMYDIERVEVLRGPQGTLYGRNATGGLINIITQKPAATAGGYVNATYGNYNTLNADGALNLPLSSTFWTRLAFASYSHDPYRNSHPANSGDDQNSQSMRLSTRWMPIDNLDVGLLVEKTRIDENGQATKYIPFNYTDAGQVDHNQPDLGSSKNFANYTDSANDINATSVRADVSYQMPLATLKYIGGYDNRSLHHIKPQPSATSLYQAFVANESPLTQNHEIRISANPGSALFWQAGLYYFREENSLFSYGTYPVTTADGTIVNGVRAYTYAYDVTTESKAAFGQIRYSLMQDLDLSAGLRYTKDSKDRSGEMQYPAEITADGVTYTATPITGVNQGSWNRTTYHVGLDYQLSAANMLYAKFDTGFKSGGFSTISDYGPETVTAYEIGSKNDFLDGRLRVNASAFYDRYKGYQVTQRVTLDSGASASDTINADSMDIYGADIDLTAKLSPVDTFTLSTAWLHARFGELYAYSSLVKANLDLTGKDLPQAPDWTVTSSYEHRWTLPSGHLTGHLQGKYVSAQHLSIFNNPSDVQDAYVTADAWLSYAPNQASWQIQAYVKNLSDEDVLVYSAEGPYNPYYAYSFAAPRTFGARVSYSW